MKKHSVSVSGEVVGDEVTVTSVVDKVSTPEQEKPQEKTQAEPEPMPKSTAVELGVFCRAKTVEIPTYATPGSAAFDIKANFEGFEEITVYTPQNHNMSKRVRPGDPDHPRSIAIEAGERAIVPTNLIFDIPKDYQLLIYPRSGASVTRGYNLANNVGVIDSDFVEPLLIIIFNHSSTRVIINEGEKIAQGELVPVIKADFKLLASNPGRKSTRIGGLGSTGM